MSTHTQCHFPRLSFGRTPYNSSLNTSTGIWLPGNVSGKPIVEKCEETYRWRCRVPSNALAHERVTKKWTCSRRWNILSPYPPWSDQWLELFAKCVLNNAMIAIWARLSIWHNSLSSIMNPGLDLKIPPRLSSATNCSEGKSKMIHIKVTSWVMVCKSSGLNQVSRIILKGPFSNSSTVGECNHEWRSHAKVHL